MENKRILILSTAYLPLIGGSELAIFNVVTRLPDYEFDIVTGRPRKELPPFEESGNARVYRVGYGPGIFNVFLPKLFLPLMIFLKTLNLLLKNNYIAIFSPICLLLFQCYLKIRHLLG